MNPGTNTPKIHHLKINPDSFSSISSGVKKAEVRRRDRDYAVGDYLELNEWEDLREDYTGRQHFCRVTHILPGGQFGIEPGFCMLSIESVVGIDGQERR